MGLTYFKRLRMELDLTASLPSDRSLPAGYELVPFHEDLVRDHATAKYRSFREELDANVFPCLARRDGCLRLMREISGRIGFVPEATWLIRYRSGGSSRSEPIGTIQGIVFDDWGAIQNVGIAPGHRCKGLGAILLMRAAKGFRSTGLTRMHLEVTTDNTAAVRLYERLGFRQAKVVYKAADVAGV
ncbi:GNAT family N-acetyltransferase [Novipirellula artificiosorum]|uniref:Acetyltransferase YpeA n=1 Tax=Novipirellula artificiosorum TaxID=2528016 RepID=A0A5C6DGU4_9BACT|nr:GNAT family N-acetyltransferase [Novipirellula artificiosorum]TWU36050.1 Acetyltransferase YpeA [Novipirellula artificiosorum]